MSSSLESPMAHYNKDRFSAPLASGKEVSHDVYTRGEGPAVVIIQELPGIGPETLSLADIFVARGFTAVIPHLFGPLGKISMLGNIGRVFCMRREFTLFSKNKSSPVVDWLKALCREHRKTGGAAGIGVIGMCLTGNFAISLMADDSVLAAVSSQPSLPLHDQSEIHMSDQDVKIISERLGSVGPMLAYRFDGDKLCRAEKFTALDCAFNNEAERIQLNTLPGKGHSVFTLDFVDEVGHPTRQALDEMLDYFTRQLIPERTAAAEGTEES